MKSLKVAAPVLAIIALGVSPLTVQAADTTTKQEIIDAASRAETTHLIATVEAVDQKARIVKLKGPEGNVVDVQISDKVKNLSEVKVGDKVDIEYRESIAVSLKPGKGPRKRLESTVVSSPEGQDKPAVEAIHKVTVVASVLEVNQPKQIIRLRGPKRIVELKVKDPKMLEKVKEGDMVEATYAEGAAITVRSGAQ